MKILNRYIIREHLGPFVLALTILTFLFLMNELIDILDLVIGKGLEVPIVLELLLYNVAWMLALTIPGAVLVSVLMSFGRLSADGEITALRSSGMSYLRFVFPVLIPVSLICAFQVYFNDKVLPEFNYQTKTLTSSIQLKQPALALQPGVFIESLEGYTLFLEEVNTETSRVDSVTIVQYLNFNAPDPPRIIRAAWGHISVDEDNGENLNLDLRNGTITEIHSGQTRVQQFDVLKTFINAAGLQLQRVDTGVRGDRELPIKDMRARAATRDSSSIRAVERFTGHIEPFISRVVRGEKVDLPDRGRALLVSGRVLSAHSALVEHLKSAEQQRVYYLKQRNRYLVEIHKKWAIPFACIAFMLIGIPLGVMTRSGGMVAGFGYALLFYLIYWVFLIAGEDLGDRNLVAPWLAMWLPNMIIGSTGLFLLLQSRRRQTVIQWSKIIRTIPGKPGAWLAERFRNT
ncbi:LptF/LptG family permease [Candidatus Zixiibacteriota bacterium]